MIAPLLKTELEPVARRYRRLLLWRGLALGWTLAALAGIGVLGLRELTGWPLPFAFPILLAAAVVATFEVWWRVRLAEPDRRWIARQIEAQHPELHALLLTAVEQAETSGAQLGYLQQRVIRDAVAHAHEHEWARTIGASQIFLAQTAGLAALLVFALVLGGLRGAEKRAALARLIQDSLTVTPGDASLERGSSLVVLARFTGQLPAEVNLVVGATPESRRPVPLVKSLDDPVFGGSLPEVTSDLIYHVEYAGQRTRDFKVTVFEHPRLERADVSLAFPDYTGLPARRIEDTKRVSAVEGTRLELALQLNKPVTTARLVAKDKAVVPLTVTANKAVASLKDFPLTASQTYELQLVDADGRTNKLPAQFVFEAQQNRPPELKFLSPRGDQRVSPLEEILFQGEVWDDFGLRAYGFAYTLAGRETKIVQLGGTALAKEKRVFSQLLPLEELALQPDQLVAYYLWADDIGPDGELRRTASDMFFAEVRPFEEIFRQGQPQDGEGGDKPPPGGQSQKLAELQKQIINATWKLRRQAAGIAKIKLNP